jgi:chemotaxis protein methyltransferase CheR
VAAPQIRAQARFERLNLIEHLPWRRSYPLIFCRNVMIYFDCRTQEQVVSRLAASLEPGGYLFVGHAESLTRISHPLEYVRPAVYRSPLRKGARWNKS